MPFCSQCGVEIPAAAKFCPSCGGPVGATSAQNSVSITVQVPKTSLRKRKRLIWTLAGALSTLLAYLYATPYIAASSFKSTVQAGGYAELTEAIDFGALRNSLKNTIRDGLKSAVEEEAEGSGDKNTDGGVFVGMVSKLADQAIEKAIQPERLVDIDQSIKDLSELFNKAPTGHSDDLSALLGAMKRSITYSTTYRGLNKFVVTTKAMIGQMTADFVFIRSGLTGWKLSGIEAGSIVVAICRYATIIQGPLHKVRRAANEYAAAIMKEGLNSSTTKTRALAISNSIREALSKGYNPNARVQVFYPIENLKIDETLLALAVSIDDFSLATVLLEEGANPNSQNPSGLTPLHFFASKADQSPTLLKSFVSKGAQVNAVTRKGMTPLMFAILHENSKAVALLLENRFDPKVSGYKGNTALHQAAYVSKKSEMEQIVRALLQHGALIQTRNMEGQTPSDIADQFYGKSDNPFNSIVQSVVAK